LSNVESQLFDKKMAGHSPAEALGDGGCLQ
jgi:hypothetical protein